MPKRLTREEIERRLLELDRPPEPEPVGERPSAMCYMVSAPPDYWVYVCPACGKRTAYVSDRDADPRIEGEFARPASDGERKLPQDDIWDMQELEATLSMARKLPKSSGILLDESALCVFCRPDARDYAAVLEISLPGQAPRRLSLDLEDVNLLRAFFESSHRRRRRSDARLLSAGVERLRSLLLGGESTEDESVEE